MSRRRRRTSAAISPSGTGAELIEPRRDACGAVTIDCHRDYLAPTGRAARNCDRADWYRKCASDCDEHALGRGALVGRLDDAHDKRVIVRAPDGRLRGAGTDVYEHVDGDPIV
jgi:hypothetical protein